MPDAPRPPAPSAALPLLPGQPLEGVDESTWLDVIQKMDEVYSQLVRDEIALEEKNQLLEQSQQFIFSLLSAMSDVLLACNEQGLIEETNAALCDLVGQSDAQLRGQPVALLMHGGPQGPGAQRLGEVMALALSSKLGAVAELNLRDPHGHPVPVDFNCTPRYNASGRRVGHVLVGRPMGELKRAYHALREAHEALKRTQQQLLHSEKMASLGRLVAGVAHELNNPISFVLGNVHALQRYTQRLQQYLGALHDGLPAFDLAELRRTLRIDAALADLNSLMEGTLEGAQRTADIVNGLKRFSAVDREEHAEVDLNAVVERAIHWVKKGTAPTFEVLFTPQPRCVVQGSAGQLLQVVMNLLQNAYDATTSASPGGLAPTPHPRLHIEATRLPGRWALAFKDNGPGISPEHMSRLFDPFFTTKPVGKGTGLGLSISYGIVERHGGSLRAANKQGGGAEFIVELPCPDTDDPLPETPAPRPNSGE